MVSKTKVQQVKDAVRGRFGERTLSRHAVEIAQGKSASRYFASKVGSDTADGEGESRKCRSVQSF
jgi:hypothetical protein